LGVQVGSPRSSYNVDLSHALEVVEEFWEKNYPEVYPDKSYNLPIFYPEQLLCGESDAGYCPADQSIIWHDNALSLYHSYYGYPALLLTFAHEWGHHIQLITGQKSNNTIPKNMELGADCYAGATFNYAEDYYSQDFSQSDFYIALFYFNILGDEEYVDWETPRKDLNGDGKLDVPHGLMRERIGAFMDGYVDGAWACNY
jgi:predicted metalloprotease